MGYRVVALSSSGAKETLARSLGAHEYLDASKGDLAEALKALGGAKAIICTVPETAEAVKLIPGLGTQGQLFIIGISGSVSEINLCACGVLLF